VSTLERLVEILMQGLEGSIDHTNWK